MTPKRLGKALLSRLFEANVRRLRANNQFKVVAVVGSVGKTTTKLAIAQLLQNNLRVQYQAGNYNDRLTVPLVFFSQPQPGIYDLVQWIRLWRAQRRMLMQPYEYDVVVLELGTDGPGQLAKLAYTQPDILVVTALTDEHMVYFKTLDAVAAEELTATHFSKDVLINIDDSPAQYIKDIPHTSLGMQAADYHLIASQPLAGGRQQLELQHGDQKWQLETSLLGQPGVKAMIAAVAVADKCGLTVEQIQAASAGVAAVSGRMQLLNGLQDSVIIDDSYNASPVAVKAALDVLYAINATQRIAILGSMNEMGALSPDMHRDVGAYCDPSKLSLVVTIGKDANEYLAPVAQQNGCQVQMFKSPYEAGEFVAKQLQQRSAVLIKGSQNRVFSEEAAKVLLADPSDARKLVRQSTFWMNKKRQQFGPQAR